MTSESLATRDMLDAAKTLAPQVAAAAARIDREGRIPAELLAALKDAGLFRLLVPASLGGAEVSLATFSQVIEEVARADASTAWCLAQNSGVCRWAAYLDHEAAGEIFGGADFGIAWGQGRSTAVKVDGGYRLTGEWSFVSGIHNATWLGCQQSLVTDAAGQPLLDASGNEQRRIFFFPFEEAEVIPVWDVHGLRGTGSDSFRVKDLFVPDRRSPGHEQPLEPGPMYVLNHTNIFTTGFASAALGLARGALDSFVELTVTKQPRDVSGVLREQQHVQIHVGKAEAMLRSSRAFLDQVIERVWQEAGDNHDLSLEARIELRLATTWAIRQAAQVVDTLHYLGGTSVVLAGGPIERRFRDMHAVTQHIQGREDHFEPAGKYLMGLDPGRLWL